MAGSPAARTRKLDGPDQVGFPNADDIYLHDTPNKDLFASDDRDAQPRLHPAARMPSGSAAG